MTTPDTRCPLDGVWRIEPAWLIAGLARTVLDIGLAGELAQDAPAAADNPGARLMATAKHHAIDVRRRG